MIKIEHIGNSLKAIKIGEISFVICKEKLNEILKKIEKFENFEVESISNKKIIFRKNPTKGIYEIIDNYLKKLEKIHIRLD